MAGMALLGHIPYRLSFLRLIRDSEAPMLDHPRKTQELLATLKEAVPFEVELAPVVIKQLQGDGVAVAEKAPYVVSDVSYAGDEGGIVCHIIRHKDQDAIVISLTYVRIPHLTPRATAILSYQKHRLKKLKKQAG
jgi:hypothetical protein